MDAGFEPTGMYLRRLQNNNLIDHLSYAALWALRILKHTGGAAIRS